jgi:hypothetical protein
LKIWKVNKGIHRHTSWSQSPSFICFQSNGSWLKTVCAVDRYWRSLSSIRRT